MTDWKKTTLGQVAQVFTGFPFKSNNYSEDPHDIKLLRGDNIAQGNLRWDDAKKWPKSEYEKYAQYQLKEGDVVLAMDRPWIGAGLKYSSVRKEDLPSLLVQRTARLRGSAELDIIYLKYIIASPWFSKYIQSINTGSLVPHISSKQIKDFPVNLPSVQQQKRLSFVLAAIDNKIDINNRINAELEAMAKTLYDYWFVQFDFPDANGNPYKTSGGKMVYNAALKREIPMGWKIKKISEVALVKAGGDKPGSYSDFRSDEFSIPVFSNGVSSEGLYGYTNVAVVNNPSITVSARGTIGYSVLRLKPFFPIIRLLVLTPYQNNALKFLEETIKRFSFENSGSVQQQLTVPQISEISVLYPTEQLLNIYTKRTWPLIKKMELIKEQSSELQQVRDWLLPLLMNGQVTVK